MRRQVHGPDLGPRCAVHLETVRKGVWGRENQDFSKAPQWDRDRLPQVWDRPPSYIRASDQRSCFQASEQLRAELDRSFLSSIALERAVGPHGFKTDAKSKSCDGTLPISVSLMRSLLRQCR